MAVAMACVVASTTHGPQPFLCSIYGTLFTNHFGHFGVAYTFSGGFRSDTPPACLIKKKCSDGLQSLTVSVIP